MKHYSGSMGIPCGMDFRDMSLEVTTVSRHTECPACVAVLLTKYPDLVQGLAHPACCFAPLDAESGHKLYAAYNRAGERKGLNHAGAPCPMWNDLPEDIRVKWRAVAAAAACEYLGVYRSTAFRLLSRLVTAEEEEEEEGEGDDQAALQGRPVK